MAKLSGAEFEKLTVPFFKWLFEKMGYVVLGLRHQASGTQNGFDIKISFQDSNSKPREIFIECKYYTSDLEWIQIIGKQMHLWGTNYEPDAFIALSPIVDISNIEDQVEAKLNTQPIFGFPSEFWTPNKEVKSFFALDDKLYEKIYDEPNKDPVDQAAVVNKCRIRIENLLNRRDEILKVLPIRNSYTVPDLYIPRKHFEADLEFDFGTPVGEPITELIEKHSRIALLAWAGMGKSYELQYLAATLSKSSKFPFLIPLGSHINKPISEYIPNIARIPQNELVVILDGLDEVQGKDEEDTRRYIIQFSREFPNAKMVVSCRSHVYTTDSSNENLNTLTSFKSFTVLPLTLWDIELFIDQQLLKQKDTLLQEVNNKGLFDLLYSPYYLQRIVRQFKEHGEITSSKAEFFELDIADNLKKDAAKHFASSRDQVITLVRSGFEKLAFILEFQGRNNCTYNELLNIISGSEIAKMTLFGSVLHGEAGTDSTWRFNHNNTQEYLAAKFISQFSLDEIKHVVGIPPKYSMAKASWANTLSLLVSILDEKSIKRKDLIEWIISGNPGLISRFEVVHVEVGVKNDLLESILRYYTEKNTRINHSKFDIRGLAKFCQTLANLKLLLKYIDDSGPINSKKNALDLLYHFDIETLFSATTAEAKKVLNQNLTIDGELSQPALRAYLHCFSLQEDELDTIVSKFGKSNNRYIRYLIYQSLHEQNCQDLQIEFILARILTLCKREMSDDGHLQNEYAELTNCIVKLKELPAIERTVAFLGENFGLIFNSIYFSDLLPEIVKHAIRVSPNSNIYTSFKKIVLSRDFLYLNESTKHIKTYFEATGSQKQIFRDIIDHAAGDFDYHTMGIMEGLATEETLAFLADEFNDSRVSRKFVDEFQYILGKDQDKLNLFNKLVNKKEVVPLPVYKAFPTGETIFNQTKELLFDKDKFKQAIQQVFSDCGKEELSFDDVFDLRKDYERYLPVIHDTLYTKKGKSTNKAALLQSLDKKWESFFIKRVIELLKRYQDYPLTDSELNLLKVWCNEMLSKVNFSEALYRDEHGVMHERTNAVQLSFLLRRLNITDLDEKVYLDLLSYHPWDDKAIQPIDFAIQILGRSKVEMRIVSNLQQAENSGAIVQDYVEYISSHEPKGALEGLLRYIRIGDTIRYKALPVYLKLKGEVSRLESILTDTNDQFKHTLIEALIQQNSAFIKIYLEKRFKSEKDLTEKLKFAKHLILNQQIKGLRYYVKTIQMKKHSLDDSSLGNPLYKLKSLLALPFLLKLFELSFDKRIHQSAYNRLSDISLTAIQSVFMNGRNFNKCVWVLRAYCLWTKFRIACGKKLNASIVPDLYYFLETMETRYYSEKSSTITIQEAKAEYSRLASLLS